TKQLHAALACESPHSKLRDDQVDRDAEFDSRDGSKRQHESKAGRPDVIECIARQADAATEKAVAYMLESMQPHYDHMQADYAKLSNESAATIHDLERDFDAAQATIKQLTEAFCPEPETPKPQ
ncbi:MAG: hypothetical protein IH931_05870, partial [candidate division Zixibacteria bacterium]|nr:hypothetical protein [candidate division Zixibacteria bacterium]